MIENVIVCLIAVAVNVAVDVCYLNYRGFFGNYFNSLFSYARNHEDSSFKDIDEKLRKLENEISQLTSDIQASRLKQNKVSDLEKTVSSLLSMMEEMRRTQGNVSSEQESRLLEELRTRVDFIEQQMRKTSAQEETIRQLQNTISVLQKQISDLQLERHGMQQKSAPSGVTEIPEDLQNLPSDVQKQKEAIIRLTQNLSSLKSQIANMEETPEIPEDLQKLPAQVQAQKKEILELHQQLSALQKKVDSSGLQNRTSHVIENSSTRMQNVSAAVSKEPVLETEVIIPDVSYVKELRNSLSALKGRLGTAEYRHCQEILDELLAMDEDELEDSEEIMNPVHEMIEKYIYGSDTKVSAEDWAYLENYIRKAGYAKVPVKPGDNIKSYQTLFSRPIAVRGGTPDTIKHVQLAPYVLRYQDGSRTESLKLCGKCSYYQ